MVPNRVIVAKRKLILVHCLIAAAALAAGVYLLLHSNLEDMPSRESGGILLLVAGGFLGLVGSLARLVRPPSLTLTPTALVVHRTFGGERSFLWGDVKEFYVASRPTTWQSSVGSMASQTDAIVSLRYASQQGLMALATGSSSGFGRDDVLPAVDFGVSPDALVALLNDYRAKATTTATPPVTQAR